MQRFISAYLPFVLLLLCGLLGSARTGVWASAYSFVYIQGDQSIPFYVKLEGEMQPRYGMHYSIIPRLETGVIRVGILFQQHAFPEQEYEIKVPEHGNRSFLLTKYEGSYALYDLQQQFYLRAGNRAEDDQLPAAPSAPYTPPPAAKATPPVTTSAVKPSAAHRTAPVRQAAPAGAQPATGPRFLEDIELAPPAGAPAQGPAIQNSDCPEPLPDASFRQVYTRLSSIQTEEARLSYLRSQMHYCYTTSHARKLAALMSSYAEQYTMLKMIYPRITDQSAFGTLSDLFDSTWQEPFLKMVR